MRNSVIRLSFLLLGAAALALPDGPASAQQFSAELVYMRPGDQPDERGSLYLSDGKVRIETRDVGGGFFLVDSKRDTAFFVRPGQRIFMDAKQSSKLTQIFVPVDPNEPCRQWQAMAIVAGASGPGGQWRCERIGSEPIDGRTTIRYRILSPDHQQDDGWIDPQLKFPIRIHTADGATIELDDIREGTQPASLFEIPAGYRKFDPQALIDRIKQSDVWVEPTR